MILFKYLLIAKLTVPIELNLMTGHFFLHFIKKESENVIFSKSANKKTYTYSYIQLSYMVNVISFKYLLIVKRIVSMEQTLMTSCFYLHFRRKKEEESVLLFVKVHWFDTLH